MINLDVKIKEEETSYPIFIENSDIYSLTQDILNQIRGKKFDVVITEKVDKIYVKVLGFDKKDTIILKAAKE